jgi:hypothetical protein
MCAGTQLGTNFNGSTEPSNALEAPALPGCGPDSRYLESAPGQINVSDTRALYTIRAEVDDWLSIVRQLAPRLHRLAMLRGCVAGAGRKGELVGNVATRPTSTWHRAPRARATD